MFVYNFILKLQNEHYLVPVIYTFFKQYTYVIYYILLFLVPYLLIRVIP